jgi:hypothetical protein
MKNKSRQNRLAHPATIVWLAATLVTVLAGFLFWNDVDAYGISPEEAPDLVVLGAFVLMAMVGLWLAPLTIRGKLMFTPLTITLQWILWWAGAIGSVLFTGFGPP